MDVKLLVCLLLMILSYSQAETTETPAATTTPNNGIRCTNGTDCPVNMCCVHNPLSRPKTPKRRRRFLFEEYGHHDHGYCRYERQLNESCFPLGHDPANPALYEFFCPCLHGLECRGQQVHETQHTLVHVSPMCQTVEN